MNRRLEHVRGLLAAARVDAVLVGQLPDVRYLSGFRGEDAVLVISADEALICTDSRFWAQVHEEVEGFDLVEIAEDLVVESVRAIAVRRGDDVALGYQGDSLSHARYRDLRRSHRGRLRDVDRRLSRLRAVKDETEVDALRRAAGIADEALRRVVAAGLVGRSEADVAWQLRSEMHALGAEDESFPAIVAAGPRGALAHAIPGDDHIARGEFVVIDMGARVDGYCSDITRTFATGAVGGELGAVYDVVHGAQLAALAAVRAGAHGSRDVDAAARRVIAEAGYGEQFGHGTGHGVGLLVHEPPWLGRVRGEALEAGMVCTVEPGVYLEGRGGVRIEDTVLVTADGHELLTHFPKDLQVVD